VGRPAFPSLASFPELATVREHWCQIRDEANVALDTIGALLGDAVAPSWILPLVPEDEDRHTFEDWVYERACELAPTAVRAARSVPYVLAFAFSKLVAGQRIAPHRHWNPYLTAILCLQGGAGCHILVGGERRDFVDGELVLFDYRLTHEVANEGTTDRIAMLLLIDPRDPRA